MKLINKLITHKNIISNLKYKYTFAHILFASKPRFNKMASIKFEMAMSTELLVKPALFSSLSIFKFLCFQVSTKLTNEGIILVSKRYIQSK